MSKSQIRNFVLRPNLRNARFKTIASDLQYRSLFAQGDDVGATLKRIFDAGANSEREKKKIRGEVAAKKTQENRRRKAELAAKFERDEKLKTILGRVERRERVQKRIRNAKWKGILDSYRKLEYRGTTIVIGDDDDRVLGAPSHHFLLSLFKRFKGKRIRVVAFNGIDQEIVRVVGPATFVRNYESTELNTLINRVVYNPRTKVVFDYKIADFTYNIPSTNTGVNRYFKGKLEHGITPWADWLLEVTSSSLEPLLQRRDIVKVYTVSDIVNGASRPQYFAQGISHCVIQPIITDSESLYELVSLRKNSKAKTNRLCQIKGGIDVLTQYAKDYSNGIPVPAIQQMVEDVSKKNLKIHISIVSPCAQKGEDQFLSFENQYGHGKWYPFVNYRYDHVGSLSSSYKDFDNITSASYEQIQSIISKCCSNGEFCEWNSSRTCVHTTDSTYMYNADQFGKRYIDFCDQFKGFKIDHNADSAMSNFILDGTHWCGNATFKAFTTPNENVKCYDLHKSYATFYTSPYYETCKFPSKLTNLQPCNKIMGPGFYRITNLNFSNASKQFVEICSKMGDPFRDKNIYCEPLLRMLSHNGVTFTITTGLWAGGIENKFDFRFTDEMIETKDYAICVGKWSQIVDCDSTCIKGSREFAEHLKSTSKNCNAYYCEKTDADPWEDDEGMITITYPKKHVWHMSQFSAYINAYEMTKMVEQLMILDLNRVIRLQKDDFLCEDHEFELLPFMRDKSDQLHETNDAGVSKLQRKTEGDTIEEGVMANNRMCYLSHIFENPCSKVIQKIHVNYNKHKKRYAHVDTQAILGCNTGALVGAGGTGKTDCLLWARKLGLLQRCVYIAQSHKLARAKADEFQLIFFNESNDDEMKKCCGLQTSVWARALHDNPVTWGLVHRYSNTLIFDEVSMMHNETCQMIMQRFSSHKIYFCGDPGCQLAAYRKNNDTNVDLTPFNASLLQIPSFTFEKIFRIKEGDDLLAIRRKGREMLISGKTSMSHDEYRCNHACTLFPSTWGQESHGRPGPAAGKTFADVENNISWYVKSVALKCESTSGLMHKFRRFVDRRYHEQQPASIDEITMFYKAHFRSITTAEELGILYESHEMVKGEYRPKDMIICSTNEYADEWTAYLSPRQPYVDVTTTTKIQQGCMYEHFRNANEEKVSIHAKLKAAHDAHTSDIMNTDKRKRYQHYVRLLASVSAGETKSVTKSVQLQKWKNLCNTRDHTNGEIVICEKEVSHDCKIAHAFTAHSTIGETARGKVFIDARNMFEMEHWETIVGRAKRAQDIIIIDLDETAPTDKYASTSIYMIRSDKGNCSYIGHTTQSLKTRIEQHKMNHKSGRKKCRSSQVLAHKDWCYELLEEFPCSSKAQAEAREMYYINRTPNAVNSNAPGTDKSLEACTPRGELLEEPIDMRKLNEIIHFIDSRIVRLLPLGENKEHDKVRDVLAFCKMLKSKPSQSVYYSYRGIGRAYAEGATADERAICLQGCFKGLRAALIGHVGHDIDLVNSVPTLLLQWVDKMTEYGLSVKEEDILPLRDYVNNRDTWLQQTQERYGITKDEAKTVFLTCLYGGTPDVFKNNENALWKSLKIIRETVVQFQITIPKYRDIYKEKLKKSDAHTASRSLFAIMTHEVEDCVIEKIREYLDMCNVSVFSLIHDGMICSDASDALLRGAEAHLAEYGWDIQLLEKPLYGLQDERIPELAPLYDDPVV